MPDTFDTASNTIWRGTANPAPLYDWSGTPGANDVGR